MYDCYKHENNHEQSAFLFVTDRFPFKEKVLVGVFLDFVQVKSLNLCMMVTSVLFYIFTSVRMTLTHFRGKRRVDFFSSVLNMNFV